MKKYVFITGMGRSGTMFLSKLLDGKESVAAMHEYIGNREFWLLSWYMSGHDYTTQYLIREKRRIDEKFGTKEIFIDINGLLQNSVAELEKVFPDALVFHLVRDGRKVVRSIYSRRNDRDVDLIPKDRGTIDWWFESDKFGQICWNWNNTTQRLIDTGKPIVKFEKLISDYEYVKERLLMPIGLSITERKWEIARAKKVNRTYPQIYRFLYAKVKGKQFISTRLPKFKDWPADKKSTFKEICGNTMRTLGYPV